MKKIVYTNKIDDEIIFHENNMLALYLEKLRNTCHSLRKVDIL